MQNQQFQYIFRLGPGLFQISQRHNVILDNDNPNLVISMGMQKRYPNAFTIYHTNEPFFPDLNNLNHIGDHFLSNFINVDNNLENHK